MYICTQTAFIACFVDFVTATAYMTCCIHKYMYCIQYIHVNDIHVYVHVLYAYMYMTYMYTCIQHSDVRGSLGTSHLA